MGSYTSDDNRSMQLNDNNDRYYSSRGIDRDDDDYDFEEENTEGENMGSYKIGNRLLLRSQIEIEPSYKVSFHHDTITVTEYGYSRSEDVKKNVTMTTVKVFLKINTIFGNTHVAENENDDHLNAKQALENIDKKNAKVSNMTYKPPEYNYDSSLGGLTADNVFSYPVLWEQESFDEKVLTDFLDENLFKYAKSYLSEFEVR
jgi:hypothetical protein